MSKMALSPRIFDTKGYDSKKLAYTMLTSGLFMKCECSVLNKDPKDYDTEFVFPRDLYTGDTITDKNAGTYFNFIKMLGAKRDNVLQCTCALDENDDERISFMSLGDSEGILSFTTFDKSKHDPNKLFESLKAKYNENTQTNF